MDDKERQDALVKQIADAIEKWIREGVDTETIVKRVEWIMKQASSNNS